MQGPDEIRYAAEGGRDFGSVEADEADDAVLGGCGDHRGVGLKGDGADEIGEVIRVGRSALLIPETDGAADVAGRHQNLVLAHGDGHAAHLPAAGEVLHQGKTAAIQTPETGDSFSAGGGDQSFIL